MTTDDALIVDKFNLSRLIRSKVAFQYGESILMAGQEINNGLSLVLFDNAIELMSSAAFEHLSHPIKKNRNFNPDFTNIKPKLGSLLETNVKIDISSILQLSYLTTNTSQLVHRISCLQ